jgi:hypothetical protein
MKENKDHEPDGLDAGLDPREYPETWFEQVLQQHVTPLLTTVKPRYVTLSNGGLLLLSISLPPTPIPTRLMGGTTAGTTSTA